MKMSIKSALLVAAVVGFAALPALAQNNDGAKQGGGQEQQFDAIKADILQRMKQTEACVQAATNFDALRACKPVRQAPPNGGGPND